MATATEGGIRVVTEPTIYLWARTQHLDDIDRFVEAEAGCPMWDTDATTPADELVEAAGRLCYMSFDPKKRRPGGNPAYIRHILDVGHGSVLEHASWTFLFTGVSRSLTHELVRHRAGMSYSQLSQRFVDSSDVAFVRPPAIEPGGATDDLWQYGCSRSLTVYIAILNSLRDDMPEAARKEVHEAARSVLPNCTETRIVVTGNARSLRHFLRMRGSAGADAEIRRLAVALAPILKADAPSIFQDVAITDAGTVEVGPC